METFYGKLPKHMWIERGYGTTCKKAQQFIERIKEDESFIVFDDPRFKATFFYDKKVNQMIKLSINIPRGSISYRVLKSNTYTHREYYAKLQGNPLGYHSVWYKVYKYPVMFDKITKLPVFTMEKIMRYIVHFNTIRLIEKEKKNGRT